MMMGMSQEKLGEQLGLTFQQVQKYEKGQNRIGASRLYAISRILDAPIQYFFEDMPVELASAEIDGAGASEVDAQLSTFLASAEGLQLNLAFSQIKDSATRRRLSELVQALASDG